ncbi:unnamed protein product, partial [Durusdinium trenchii]
MARDLAPHSKDGTEGPQMSKVRLAAAAVKLCKPCSKQAAAHAVARPSMPQQQLIAPVSDWNKAELVSDAACFWWLDSEQKWHHWRYDVKRFLCDPGISIVAMARETESERCARMGRGRKRI